MYFPKCKIQQIFRATLARAARNRLNFWREAAREALRLTREISRMRRASRAVSRIIESISGSPESGFSAVSRIDFPNHPEFKPSAQTALKTVSNKKKRVKHSDPLLQV